MVVIVIMIVLVPSVMAPEMAMVPIPAALVVTMNPAVMLPITRHPDVMPSPVPELRAFVIPAVADVNFQTDRLCGWIKHRARRDQDRQ